MDHHYFVQLTQMKNFFFATHPVVFFFFHVILTFCRGFFVFFHKSECSHNYVCSFKNTIWSVGWKCVSKTFGVFFLGKLTFNTFLAFLKVFFLSIKFQECVKNKVNDFFLQGHVSHTTSKNWFGRKTFVVTTKPICSFYFHSHHSIASKTKNSFLWDFP
jgi:hypothetical protein